MIEATCHCGAVRIGIPAEPESATSCNCSICRRLGALWAFFPLGAVQVAAGSGATQEYAWGKQTRRFVRCATCGCTTHVNPASPGPDSEIEVNMRLFEQAQVDRLRVRLFDGATAWKYVGELPPHASNGGA
jgi:hypothetical protein